MKIEQFKWTPLNRWQVIGSSSLNRKKASLVLAFGDRFVLEESKRFDELREVYPNAQIILTSTSGNVLGVSLDDQSIASTAIEFEKSSKVSIQRINIVETQNSFTAGQALAKALEKDQLKHVFLISDGHLVNGSELVKGMVSTLPHSIPLTGGLAGDGTRFEKTIVGLNATPKEGEIVAIGFYGNDLKFGFGSVGGWDPFGIERKITRSTDNVLFELDGKIALELYKKYLGDQAAFLPSSALLFPLAIRPDTHSTPIVRTILSINEEDQSMIFAGDVPEGWYAQLMKVNFDRLVDGASLAATSSHEMLGKQCPDLAILISCVGRRMVLDQRTEEELEIVRDIIGKESYITGFYSYGEIAPTSPEANCELHNQTMTITTIMER